MTISTTPMLPKDVYGIANRIIYMFTSEDLGIVLSTTRPDMIKFHHSVGMTIRNVYNLWTDHPLTNQWRQDKLEGNDQYMIEGIDHHPNHPDHVSMEILYTIWDIVHTS